MEITETEVFLRNASPNTRLKAYVKIVFDNVFVVRNIRIIEGQNGIFVAMPSRKIKQPCPVCGFRNDSRSKYCNQCGGQLKGGALASSSPVSDEHKDIVHPISKPFREYIQKKILEAYKEASGGNHG